MNKILLLGVNVLMIFVLIACQSIEPPSHHSMLKPGDNIDGMVITTGTAQAYPLWIFCSPPQENNGIIFVDCQVPPGMRLAIVHTFGAVDQALLTSDWSELTWTLSLDDRLIDLPSFGTLELGLPGLASHPTPIREVFSKSRVWDVVLENLTPGVHTLLGSVESIEETYSWNVTFTVISQ